MRLAACSPPVIYLAVALALLDIGFTFYSHPFVATLETNALEDVTGLQFRNSAVRCPYADWERDQQSKPACHATIRYNSMRRLPILPDNALTCFLSHHKWCPRSFPGVAELGGWTTSHHRRRHVFCCFAGRPRLFNGQEGGKSLANN